MVNTLVRRAQSLRHTVVALVHGLRRTGKTFSMPWAQLEAIRMLERDAAGADPSPAAGEEQYCHNKALASEGANGACREPLRRRNVMVVQCHQVTAMDLDQIPVLLAAVVGCFVCDYAQSMPNTLHNLYAKGLFAGPDNI